MSRSRRRPEKREERKFVSKVATRLNGEAIKLGTLGPYGVVGRNDRLVLLPGRVVLLIEFKREGEEPTDIQRYRHKKYRKMGFPVYVAITCEEALGYCEAEIRSQAVSKKKHRVRA